jgi:hypothetical protein
LLEGAMKRLYLSVVIFVLVVGFSTISWAEGKLPLQGSIGVGARNSAGKDSILKMD